MESEAFRTEMDPTSTQYVHSGSHACAIALQTWGQLDYMVEDPDGLPTFGYATLEFWINPGKASCEARLRYSTVSFKKKQKKIPLVQGGT